MSTLSEIQNAVLAQKNGAQDATRRSYLKALGRYTGRDTITYATAFTVPKLGVPQGVFAVDVGDIPGFMSALHGLRGENLDLILHSPGGSFTVLGRIGRDVKARDLDLRQCGAVALPERLSHSGTEHATCCGAAQSSVRCRNMSSTARPCVELELQFPAPKSPVN